MAKSNRELMEESFGRCVLKKEFFSDFYNTFFASSPDIPPYFNKTNMTKQYELLREGLSFIILFDSGNTSGKLAIDRVGRLHDVDQVNVRPEHYKYWVDSLVKTVEKFDHRYTPEVGRVWEETAQKAIRRFVELYNG